MLITLTCIARIDVETISHYNPELDSILLLLDNICDYMINEENCSFAISGFGQSQWPVNDSVELSIFLEQLPYSLKMLSKNSPFEFEFYEQGFERTLKFIPLEEKWKIYCCSDDDSFTNPHAEMINNTDLNKMLSEIMESFLTYIKPITVDDSKGWGFVIENWKSGLKTW